MNSSQQVEKITPSVNPYSIYCNDCIDILKLLEKDSVDLVLTDLPYGISQNKWDQIIDIKELWTQWKRILKPRGAVILTSCEPFTSSLILSNPDWFRYDIIWKKTISSGQLNVKRMPLRQHENILIFYDKAPTYNEQLTPGKPYKVSRKKSNSSNVAGESGYGAQKASSKVNTGYRHATSVLEISNPRIRGEHPSHKPVELMEWFIKTYSNEGEIVLDCCMGTGSTGVAALKNNRRFIGMEIDKKYFDKAKAKLELSLSDKSAESNSSKISGKVPK